MSDKPENSPSYDEFDDVEDTGELPGRARREAADLALLREAIRDHGKTMGEVNAKLVQQADELAELQERCKRNAHNIRVLAKRLGLRIDGGASDDRDPPALAPIEPEGGKEP
jgi:hypothetical protein